MNQTIARLVKQLDNEIRELEGARARLVNGTALAQDNSIQSIVARFEEEKTAPPKIHAAPEKLTKAAMIRKTWSESETNLPGIKDIRDAVKERFGVSVTGSDVQYALRNERRALAKGKKGA